MASNTITTQIVNAMKSDIATILGPNYNEIPYVYDVAKNNFRTSKARYGVRPLSTVELDGVVKATTHVQTFEVVLTEGYLQATISDSALQDKALLAFDNMHAIYKQLAQYKCGVPLQVLMVQNLSILDPEVLEEDKVVVLRANIDVMYRIEF